MLLKITLDKNQENNVYEREWKKLTAEKNNNPLNIQKQNRNQKH